MANPYVSLLRTAWTYARQEKQKFVFVYGLFICANIISAAHPILFGWFIDKVQKHNDQVLHFTMLYVGAFIVLKLSEWAFHGPARILERQLAFNLSRNFLQERYHQALHLPVKWHQDHHSGATINRIRKAYEALKGFFDGGFLYIHALSKFFFSFAAMLYFSPLFGSIGIGLGILTIWVIFKFDKPFIKTQEEVNEREHIISATLFDSLSNINTVITLRLEKSMESGLLSKVKDLLKPFRRNVIINEWKWFTADMLVAVTYGVITFGYIYQQWDPAKVFYVGGLVTLLGYVNQFTSVFHDVAWQYTQIVQYNTDVQTASGIASAYTDEHRPDNPSALPKNWQRIVIKGLSFSHRDSYSDAHAPQSIHEINLVLEKGKKTALIGESGSGKTTILALLRGLYSPEPGLEITVDGTPLTLDALNQSVTLFPQEPEIFENTIAYNVTLGLPFEESRVRAVCEAAHFTEVIAQLPKGLESSIQEKGVNLSGGQKQRLALARGILAAEESEVILLDEPTSSVDPKTEAHIYANLFAACADKVVVSALHRLHLLVHFDHIIVLKQGRVAEEGSFNYLRENGPLFRELWRHQEELEKSQSQEAFRAK
ncbi:ABC transporter ATP-binding protein [Flavihumibacter profundi]|uniref:ABC transporter ATP-binding protein n=1 Tax=Flavihumibacter profundi TaxID=2716883 RepID=UPI001CC42BDA|nr:ABC transporter ATP-binding protein [Flavihumibacter profundi]MBZ5857795.1 ABC transporter ATP-binding protein/permease [Flavihumibacter profundi]